MAVVGGGGAGLTTAWLLKRAGRRVVLLEAGGAAGGHTLTADLPGGLPAADVGFQVFNLTNYPNFNELLRELDVDSEPSDMTFSLSLGGGALEWGSRGGLAGLLAQPSNALKPWFWQMLRDIFRFERVAPKVLEPENAERYEGMSLADFLEEEGFSLAFRDNYVLPMSAAVWSCPHEQAGRFPVQTLVRFWANHLLLETSGRRPLWRVVKGRSRTYVDKILADLGGDVHLGSEVVAVEPKGAGGLVRVRYVERSGGWGEDSDEGAGGSRGGGAPGREVEELFDEVVLATHADVSLKILGNKASAAQRRVLQGVPFTKNEVVVHTDSRLMPRRRAAWAAWNCLYGNESRETPVCVSYWVNLLQNYPEGTPDVFVTLNPVVAIDEDKVLKRYSLSHPEFGFPSDEAQKALPDVQGHNGVWLAGAWCGYGFHEDGVRSALAVAKGLGVEAPWAGRERALSPRVSVLEFFFLQAFKLFCSGAIKEGHLRVILPTGDELSYGDPQSDAAAVMPLTGAAVPLRITMLVKDMALFQKIVLKHDSGLGEGYFSGDFEFAGSRSPGDGLYIFLALLTRNARNIEGNRMASPFFGALNWAGDKMLYYAHLWRENTVEGSRKNIEEHYDAGNAMYRTFLDESMMYSCAIFEPGDDLAAAQRRKLDHIIERAEISAEDHVLEIGCGWGEFALRAARTTGCRVTGVTISKEQLSVAQRRLHEEGLEDRVKFLLCDYRHIEGTFDKVVSIEMIEAVGQKYLAGYFQTIGRTLRPGGRAVLQAISVPDERYAEYCNASDFIREHIFPGGHLPCLAAMREASEGTGLALLSSRDIGTDYAVTLEHWRAAWERNKGDVLALGYSEKFWRKYLFYFEYCSAAFQDKYIHNYIVTWMKE